MPAQQVHNGTGLVLPRHPTIFKSNLATSGTVAVWTPSAARFKFRLLRYRIMVTGEATLASGARCTLQLKDNATNLGQNYEPYIPAAAPTNPPGLLFDSGIVDLGGVGILSSTANNALNIVLGTTLATGTCRVLAWGTEE